MHIVMAKEKWHNLHLDWFPVGLAFRLFMLQQSWIFCRKVKVQFTAQRKHVFAEPKEEEATVEQMK